METDARLRNEKDILDRIENVKRLIQMETTLLTAHGARSYTSYCLCDRDGNKIGENLLYELRDEIQLQLLSLTALCYGDSPDIGEPMPMLEWADCVDGECATDRFRDVWEKCLRWNA